MKTNKSDDIVCAYCKKCYQFHKKGGRWYCVMCGSTQPLPSKRQKRMRGIEIDDNTLFNHGD